MSIADKGACPWLLLTFRLPARQATQRVEIWRKLKQLGALGLRSSGHLLPGSAQNQERFQWLAAAIRKYKGEASVIEARSIDALPSEEIKKMFQEARAHDYESLLGDIKMLPEKSAPGQLTRLRRRLQEIAAIDFFESPMRSRVESALARVEGGPPAQTPAVRRTAREYRGRTWITRPRPGIDRVSSAWLIRRFIDPQAKFLFDADPKRHAGAVPFDMFHAGGFGHRGDDCTFETLRKEFALRDTRIAVLAEMIHDADLGDQRFARAEALGLDRVLIGWAQQGVPDDELLRRGMELIEGLYHSIPAKNP